MTTHPSDWAVAQAWREVTAGMPFAYPDNLINAVNDRARELDASGTTNSAQISSSLVVEQREDGAVRASASRQAHDMLIDLRAAASIGRPITGDELHELEQDILRAIEQALTQQRGSASYDAGMAMHWIERYAAGIDEECQLDRIAEAFTTPQPSADAVRELQDEVDRLNAIVNTPQSNDFLRAVSTEAEHQRQRWGSDHDAGKAPADWFWLVGYLAGKALHAHATGDVAKAEHHIITTAAALANWHLAAFGKTDMRPGIDGESLLGRGG